jgi:hypothetical protein
MRSGAGDRVLWQSCQAQLRSFWDAADDGWQWQRLALSKTDLGSSRVWWQRGRRPSRLVCCITVPGEGFGWHCFTSAPSRCSRRIRSHARYRRRLELTTRQPARSFSPVLLVRQHDPRVLNLSCQIPLGSFDVTSLRSPGRLDVLRENLEANCLNRPHSRLGSY